MGIEGGGGREDNPPCMNCNGDGCAECDDFDNIEEINDFDSGEEEKDELE